MRIIFECYAIYSAVICTALTSVLALGLDDDKIEWVARKVINISFLLYGPVLIVLCCYGFKDIHALSKVCTLQGISTHHTNYVTVFVLFACFCFALGCSLTMTMEKTMDMAQLAFTNENSIMYRITQMYYQYQVRLRERRERQRIRERRYRREDRDEERAIRQEVESTKRQYE